ncbi:MAG: PEP-CTERM sorting domain-containing protein [Acidobacteria bacterium]|nr:PEP-CTERM sorting domain-containing protein [Acidobacteriota bacterium]
MKLKLAALLLLGFVLSAPHSMFADQLTLVSATGSNVGGVITYPYNFKINGTTNASLMCLDYTREVTVGESWQVSVSAIPLDFSSTSINYRAAALIYSQLGNYSTSDLQFAAWGLFDHTSVVNNPGYNSTVQYMDSVALQYAQDQSIINSGFYSQFSLYIPTSDTTGWTSGTPQRFIGAAPAVAPTPEPSSLMLLGTGLLGTAGILRRKYAAKNA